MQSKSCIGVDLGGTNIKAAVCRPDGTPALVRSIATEASRGFDHVFGRIVALIRELIAATTETQFVAVGIGAPGPMSHSKGMIYRAPNLPGWTNIPLREKLSDAIGLPVTLENDGNAAAFGEFTLGAGRDVNDIVLLTLGTGVGGGIVVEGNLWRGSFDNAAEVGHMIVAPGGRPCPCGQRGCLERYASANAVHERLVEALDAGEDSQLSVKRASGQAISAADVEQAMVTGDALAARIWDDTCRYLAIAVINLQHVINPARVLFGGGLINAGERLLQPIRRHFEALTWKIAPDAPDLAFASLGGDAGMIGCAALARGEFARI